MKRFLLAALLALPLLAAIPEATRVEIDNLTKAKGAYTAAEDVYRVAFPRTDVKVNVDGRPLHPFLGLTSWAAFTPASDGALMVMGDLVLFEDEVNAAMSAALDAGLEVTALHNHFFHDSPRVMFMHIGGHGPAAKLAAGVRAALDAVQSIRNALPQPATQFSGPSIPATDSIDAAALDAILGLKGQSNAGMYKIAVGREASMHGKTVNNQMGVNTWAAFAGSMEAATVDGDFAMLESELLGVLKVLRQANINIVAIHNHMTHEEPQYVFLHYWGKGNAIAMAKALKAAMDTQQPKRAQMAQPTRNIVFVCEHGAAKSVIAAAYFNQIAAARGLAIRAISRGTSPDPEIGASTRRGLIADGFPAPDWKPTLLSPADAQNALHVVTLAAPLPASFSGIPTMEWNDNLNVGANYAQARDVIRAHVGNLVEKLAAHHAH
ncbi:MAG: DUF1259 domain-containing protein [Bryobacter sp.]|nr:DUF1259 domain-containing protein [Bryobacter sp.]